MDQKLAQYKKLVQQRPAGVALQIWLRQSPDARRAGPTGVMLGSIGRRMTMKIGRSARTGRFTTVSKARKNAPTHVVETIKRSGPKRTPKAR